VVGRLKTVYSEQLVGVGVDTTSVLVDRSVIFRLARDSWSFGDVKRHPAICVYSLSLDDSAKV